MAGTQQGRAQGLIYGSLSKTERWSRKDIRGLISSGALCSPGDQQMVGKLS